MSGTFNIPSIDGRPGLTVRTLSNRRFVVVDVSYSTGGPVVLRERHADGIGHALAHARLLGANAIVIDTAGDGCYWHRNTDPGVWIGPIRAGR